MKELIIKPQKCTIFDAEDVENRGGGGGGVQN